MWNSPRSQHGSGSRTRFSIANFFNDFVPSSVAHSGRGSRGCRRSRPRKPAKFDGRQPRLRSLKPGKSSSAPPRPTHTRIEILGPSRKQNRQGNNKGNRKRPSDRLADFTLSTIASTRTASPPVVAGRSPDSSRSSGPDNLHPSGTELRCRSIVRRVEYHLRKEIAFKF